ncbi:MAG: TIGR02281 family clan AA aspartic protease [Kiritimatiellia bacterium]|nr:TIGR02281 family clan AA aspartic protease [Kiritimatiellia bacterium]
MCVARHGLLLVIMGIACIACADRVTLNNGRHLDGLVVSEGRDAITLRVEGGEMQVARRRIKEVRYSTPPQSRALEESWKRKYFLHEDYIPPGMADLAKRMRALRDRRKAAVSAHRGIESSAVREKQLRRERDSLHAELVQAGEELQRMDPQKDVHAYNKRVALMNSLRSQVTTKSEALQAMPELKRGRQDVVAAYRQDFAALRSQVVAFHSGGGGGNSEERVFLNRLLIETGRMATEFHTNTAPLNHDRYGHTVQATINGKEQGRFVVDTGAAVVTLSEAFAKQVGLEWNTETDGVELILANGDRVNGFGVLLDSVAVGGMSARHVRGVVLERPPAEEISGLLGMSFLDRFQVKITPGNERLTFTRFSPGE